MKKAMKGLFLKLILHNLKIYIKPKTFLPERMIIEKLEQLVAELMIKMNILFTLEI